jgi:hypothetical protein
MAKKTLEDHMWRISRIRGTPAADVGTVEAPDAKTAIQIAIEKYKIAGAEKQKRLVAQRVR